MYINQIRNSAGVIFNVVLEGDKIFIFDDRYKAGKFGEFIRKYPTTFFLNRFSALNFGEEKRGHYLSYENVLELREWMNEICAIVEIENALRKYTKEVAE